MAERASLENWRPRKGSASSNLAPSANGRVARSLLRRTRRRSKILHISRVPAGTLLSLMDEKHGVYKRQSPFG